MDTSQFDYSIQFELEHFQGFQGIQIQVENVSVIHKQLLTYQAFKTYRWLNLKHPPGK